MNPLREAVSELVRDAPPKPALQALRRRTRRRRFARGLSAIVVIAFASAGVVGVVRSRRDPERGPRIGVSTPTAGSVAASPTTQPNPRGAAANVRYVKQLVAEHRLPHSANVTEVQAVEDRVVLRTTLTDSTQAAELWEGLARVLSCDDSFLLIKGHSVVLANGTRVDGPRPGFQACADTNGPALAAPTGTVLCRADELEVAPGPSLQLIRLFNRSGRSCGLAGFVSLFGRVDGRWRPVESVPLGTSVTNGPRWTGVFDPSLTAVISINPAPAAFCVATSPRSHYTGLRLALPRAAGTIDIDSIQFDANNCPPWVSPVEADSQDN